MAALPIALFSLMVPFRFLACTELRSWILEVHGILAQTVVLYSLPLPGHSVWVEPRTSYRVNRPLRVLSRGGGDVSLLPSPWPWYRPLLALWSRLIPVAWPLGCLGALWAATEAGAKYLCPLQAHVSPVLLLLNVYLLQLPCSPWWLLMGVTGTLL